MSTSISVIEPLFFLPFSHFSQNPNTLLCNCLLALLWILVIFWLDNNRICIAKAFRNVCRLFALTFLQTLLEIKRIVFYWRSCLESQVFFKSDRLTWWVFTVLLSHSNSFASKAFLIIGDVHIASFALQTFGDKETNNMHGIFVDTERYPLTLNQLVSTIRRSVIWMLPG